ncbi:HD domain-containing protein [Virgibacillus sp. YIM 98842]|uniref:HD domain-containing protein n=1 Tax=Virgibacillus sp. YIM 98842 TaxID=2663533 RepID=UPI0013DB9F30|nr:HD domain-containing protein [Virgibacillus sp. YIM 98842]
MEQQAKDFAEKAHDGQYRKTSRMPYITHPIRVAERLEKAGCAREVVSAGYLHDVVEDTQYEIEDIHRLFGSQVAELVAAHTEDKSKSWQERKQHTIDTVKHAEKEVKYLIIADKLDNLLSLEKEIKIQGEDVWNHFNAGFEKQKWFHQAIAENMYAGLAQKDIPLYFPEFQEVVKRVFK